jgi:uncharacterized membrane protein YdjX (TVP38/TMEM64 family)
VVRRAVPVLALLALLIGALLATPHVMDALRWIETLGPLGHAVFGGFYVVATLVLVPAGILEAAAGFQYGPWLGLPVAWVLGVLSATLSFVLGRTLFRPWVERRIAANPRLDAISRGIAREGAWLVFWLRLSPLAPFNALHMPLGATRIPLPHFVAATAVGHLFPVVLFVLTGAAVDSFTDFSTQRPTLPPWGVAAGVVTALVASVGVSRIARRALRTALDEAPPAG